MKEISAKVIADSQNLSGDRITSLVLTFPRFILAELNTHRAFSRNSASSRAIPFEKMVNMVKEDPFIPINWMKDHTGMQGNEYFTEEECKALPFLERWLQARDNAVESAKELSRYGVTKQICNRLLEPFMWHTAIVTATDFENFFSLRYNEGAEIHFQKLAYCMLEQLKESRPKVLADGQYHIPFGDKIDKSRIDELYKDNEERYSYESCSLKISTARCARISYLNFEGKDDYSADIKRYNSLLKAGHMSPFEHCAQAAKFGTISGNFKGFIQLRKTIEGENRTYKI